MHVLQSQPLQASIRLWVAIVAVAMAVLASGCAGPMPRAQDAPAPGVDAASSASVASAAPAEPAEPLPPALQQAKSRWVPVRWGELPGFADDALHEAWNAWLRSCERPGPALAALCPEVRQLSIADAVQQRAFIMERLQPYRVEPLPGASAAAVDGLLTGYYEPLLSAARNAGNGYAVPLYRLPAQWGSRKPWYTRQEADTLPEAKAALRGREIAYLADPLDALVLQIQGSGRVRITEADGSVRMLRLAFAGSNDQPYKSVGRWLLDQGAVTDASWPGIKAWAQQNPQRVQEMLWSNPRLVFFKEEPLNELDAAFGPRGAQGVALTPGRSIAVDPGSIPYSTPVWLASGGPTAKLQRLVFAQDTGSAITGAIRADYFTGWGPEAAELAGKLKQGLQLWVLWPK